MLVLGYFFEVHSGAVGWGTAQQARMSRFQFSLLSLKLFVDFILLPWGHLTLQQKGVPGIFPVGVGATNAQG